MSCSFKYRSIKILSYWQTASLVCETFLDAWILGHSYSPLPKDARSLRHLLMESRLHLAGQDLTRPRHHWNSCGELTQFRIERRVNVDFLDRQGVRETSCGCVSVN